MWSGSHWVSQFTTHAVGLSEPVSCSASYSSCGCSLSLSRNNSHGIVWQRTRGQNWARELGYRSGQLGSWVLKAISGFHSVALPKKMPPKNAPKSGGSKFEIASCWNLMKTLPPPAGQSVRHTLTTLPLYKPTPWENLNIWHPRHAKKTTYLQHVLTSS